MTRRHMARFLLAAALWLGAGCGRIGFELLPPSERDGRPADGMVSVVDAGGVGDAAVAAMDGATTSMDASVDDAEVVAGSGLDLGSTDVCIEGRCASDVDRCPGTTRDYGGVCGCAGDDAADEDDDGTPDCVDQCVDAIDRLEGGVCGCDAGSEDDDGDGVVNCNDGCPFDPDKELPGVCGCGQSDADSDGDGMPDCADLCVDAPEKLEPGVCGCGSPDSDADDDGLLDCEDTCGGWDDSAYEPIGTCGLGYCRTTNTPSSCVDGVETACQPGAPLAAQDTTCDGVDDDCDGQVDEDYVVVTSCGQGICATTATASSCTDGVETACQPGSPLSGTDTTCDGVDDDCSGTADEDYVIDASCGTGYCQDNNTPSSCVGGIETLCQEASPFDVDDDTADGVDDDCDGSVDEDACVPTTETYGPGTHALTPSPACTTMEVKLWGGAGAAGEAGGWYGSVTPGAGGAGGFAASAFSVDSSSSIELYVGRGGGGCGAGGTNDVAAYSGGAAGTSLGADGSDGEDGSQTGGSGGSPGSGGAGGDGSFGGGGGGSGGGFGWNPFGRGGSGGAATVLLVDATRVSAGGGGGGGGVGNTIASNGTNAGPGGAGCSESGSTAASSGGGGGGGGICEGDAIGSATGRTPEDPDGDLTGDTAMGGSNSSECDPGGDGYAVIRWLP